MSGKILRRRLTILADFPNERVKNGLPSGFSRTDDARGGVGMTGTPLAFRPYI